MGGYLWQALVLLPGVNSTRLKTVRTTRIKNDDGLLHRLVGLPGPTGLTRFTAGAAVPGITPRKIYSCLLTALYPLQCQFIRLSRKDTTHFLFFWPIEYFLIRGENTLWAKKTAVTRSAVSAVTPPKVNRFG